MGNDIATPKSSLRNNITVSFLLIILVWGVTTTSIFQYVIKSILESKGLEKAVIEDVVRYFITVSTGLTLAGLFVISIIAIFLSSTISRPIKKLTEGVTEVARGNLDVEIDVTTQDECGQLADSFNMMTRNLREITVSRDLLYDEIKERRKAEEMLEKLYNQNQLLLNAAGEGIYGLDTEGKTTFLNPAAAQMIGWEPEELIGKSQHDILHHTRPDGTPYPREECPIYSTFKDGSVHRVEEEVFWRRDGSSFPVEYISSPIRDKYNNLTGAVVTFKDISKRKEMENELVRQAQELMHSNTELQRIGQIASHDLQEPLRIVTSYVQLIAKRYKGRLDQDADEFIGFVEGGTEKMRALVKGLLIYSRIGTHGKPFAKTNSGSVVEKALIVLQKDIEESKAEITYDPLPEIIADEGQLTQLFQYLISNAIKFNDKEPPRVHISVLKDGDNQVFSVKDNGIGIEEKNQERVFHIFQRFQSQSEYAGTEIGLALCRRIVERHGGRIWIESELGQGTTIYFTIPDSSKIKKNARPAFYQAERIEDYEIYEM